jgi:hypothetical protein
MPMSNRDSNWFRPLWRRVAVCVFVAGWFCWELLYTHDQTWMMIVLALFAYAIWIFFIRFDSGPKNPEDGSGT